ncbi:39c7040b-a5c7-4d49-83a3-bac8802675ea [Thermothielavioides terrestris]
MYQS